MAKRISLILDDVVEAEIRDFAVPNTPAHEALAAWINDHDLGSVTSEASVWRALLRVGARTVREAALEDGYARLSKEYAAPELAAERRAARDRYVRRTEANL
ncbi:MAG: hypothetical protein LBK72_07230 [Bifidobacteriaceae bacterium]|jgi:hypothetical protein|nr:hypothetical protein [Bifidobacteriaceae bacterium]